jgi:ankyrin repeat protein
MLTMRYLLFFFPLFACIFAIANTQNVTNELLQDANATDEKGFTGLYLAAYEGDPEKVKQYLDAGADPNQKDTKGRCPLHAAANGNHPAVVYLLLDRGADINLQDNSGATLLYWVARNNNRELLDELLKRGVKITQEGWHPLLGASVGGRFEMMEYFLNAGIPIDAYDHNGWNALHIAASHKNQPVIEWLLKRGANINSSDKDGWTPLMRTLNADADLQLVEFFIKNGANINARTEQDVDCLYIATRYSSKPDVVELLLKSGATLALSEEARTRLFMGAIYNGSSEAGDLVRLLIKYGIDPKRPFNGSSLLFWAARDGKSPDIIRVLRSAGVEIKDNEGVEYVAVKNSEEMALALLESGLGVKSRNDLLVSSIELKGKERLLQKVLQLGCEVNYRFNQGNTALVIAIKENTQYVPILINAGADVNLANDEGTTPLMEAVAIRNKELIALLLRAKAKIDQADNDGKTPLMVAVYRGYEDIVALLLESGADVTIKDPAGGHALSYLANSSSWRDEPSVKSRLEGIMDSLIQAGLSIDDKNNEGATLLMLATSSFNEPLMGLVLSKGGDINDRDKNGNTLFHYLHAGYMQIQYNIFSNVVMEVVMAMGFWGSREFTEEEMDTIRQVVSQNMQEYDKKLASIFKKLQEAGAKVDVKNKDGVTPLMLAAKSSQDPQWIQYLLDCGLDVNASDKDGKTVLIYAISNPNPEPIVSVLIAGYADIEAKDNEGKTALDYAREQKLSRVVTALIKAKSKQ